MFAILGIIDALIIAALLFGLCESILGDSPLSRLLRILFTALGGFAYFVLCAMVCNSYTISMWLGCIILFGPIALAIVVWILRYMFK